MGFNKKRLAVIMVFTMLFSSCSQPFNSKSPPLLQIESDSLFHTIEKLTAEGGLVQEIKNKYFAHENINPLLIDTFFSLFSIHTMVGLSEQQQRETTQLLDEISFSDLIAVPGSEIQNIRFYCQIAELVDYPIKNNEYKDYLMQFFKDGYFYNDNPNSLSDEIIDPYWNISVTNATHDVSYILKDGLTPDEKKDVANYINYIFANRFEDTVESNLGFLYICTMITDNFNLHDLIDDEFINQQLSSSVYVESLDEYEIINSTGFLLTLFPDTDQTLIMNSLEEYYGDGAYDIFKHGPGNACGTYYALSCYQLMDAKVDDTTEKEILEYLDFYKTHDNYYVYGYYTPNSISTYYAGELLSLAGVGADENPLANNHEFTQFIISSMKQGEVSLEVVCGLRLIGSDAVTDEYLDIIESRMKGIFDRNTLTLMWTLTQVLAFMHEVDYKFSAEFISSYKNYYQNLIEDFKREIVPDEALFQHSCISALIRIYIGDPLKKEDVMELVSRYNDGVLDFQQGLYASCLVYSIASRYKIDFGKIRENVSAVILSKTAACYDGMFFCMDYDNISYDFENSYLITKMLVDLGLLEFI